MSLECAIQDHKLTSRHSAAGKHCLPKNVTFTQGSMFDDVGSTFCDEIGSQYCQSTPSSNHTKIGLKTVNEILRDSILRKKAVATFAG
jgi:hypothetical protein